MTDHGIRRQNFPDERFVRCMNWKEIDDIFEKICKQRNYIINKSKEVSYEIT